jgi:hypothetical protein
MVSDDPAGLSWRAGLVLEEGSDGETRQQRIFLCLRSH